MGTKTGIEWTDHTFNPWIGCTKVSAGCANCYAKTRDDRHMLDGREWKEFPTVRP
jgi:protein gp37